MPIIGTVNFGQFQDLMGGIGQGLLAGQPITPLWGDFQGLIQSGQYSPLVRAFLGRYELPQIDGEPTRDEFVRITKEIGERMAPGPIRRKDFVAQNSVHWAHRTAVRQGRRKKLTYRTLDERADIIGTFLSGCRRKIDDRVAIFFSQNLTNIFEITLGVRRAGGSFTNFHAYLSAEEFLAKIEDYVEKDFYRFLFVDSETLSKLEPILPLLQSQDRIIVDIDSQYPGILSYGHLMSELERPGAQTPDLKPPPYRGPVMYSSGTTGQPKLISVPAKSRVGADANKIFGIKEDDHNLVVGQLYHGGAYSWARGHVNRGAEVILLDQQTAALHPQDTLQAIEQRKITNFWISPPWLQGLCLYLDETTQPFDHSSLRAIYVGAAPFHPVLKRQAVKRFGPIIWENYATTEFGLVTILKPEDLLKHATTAGKAAPGVEMQIRNETEMENAIQPLTPGQEGRIWVKNEQTHGQFVMSDDLGVLDEEGYLTILGRVHEKIVSGGVTVYPRVLENALMEMPGIRDAHVIGIPHASLNEEVIAAVVFDPGIRIHQREIMRYLERRDDLTFIKNNNLPIRIVSVPALPRKPYKVNIATLRDMILNRGTSSRR